MNRKVIGATEFKADCLKLINQMNSDGEPVLVTRHGHAVAMLSPAPEQAEASGIIGALKGTVKNFTDPFTPVTTSQDWNAAR